MLNISVHQRATLHESGALIRDNKGLEVLEGLTLAESNFVLNVEQKYIGDFSIEEITLYKKLRVIHLAARLKRAQYLPKDSAAEVRRG